MEFWIAVDGATYGPYEPAQVQEMVQGGQLAADAEIWFPDRDAWVPAAYLVGFVPAPEYTPEYALAGVAAGAEQAPASQAVHAEYAAAQQPVGSGILPQQWDGYPDQQAPAGRSNGNPFAIGALVLGVAALGISWLPLFNLLSLAAAGLGVVLVVLALLWVRKGAGGKGIALAGLVVCVLAAAVSILLSTVFVTAINDATDQPAQAVQEQQPDPVLITLGAPRWDGSGTTVRARVANTSAQPVNGGMFTVQAVARNGTVVDQTTGAVPTLPAGEAAPVQVVFVKRIPAGATISVTDVSASS